MGMRGGESEAAFERITDESSEQVWRPSSDWVLAQLTVRSREISEPENHHQMGCCLESVASKEFCSAE